ncbi:MAG: prolyl aminopeptidase [archaeon]
MNVIKRSYKRGYLKVSKIHSLYYELYGNPKGKPVLFLHGGPGGGFSERDKRFFNPRVYKLILFDQRGSGRSKPFASLKENTTFDLVEDIKKLLTFLKIKKTFLFGGSWGSTLALVYAIKYPKTVSGMLLRGIFLCSKNDIKHYFGGDIKNFFPEVWERFVSNVPKQYRNEKGIPSYYLKMMNSKDKKVKEKYTFEWAFYEMSILKLKTKEEKILKLMKEFSYKSLAPLEAYYLKNNCFIHNNYILNNCNKISSIPVSIIHGRYDFVCPAINAFNLHSRLKNSKLYIVCAGHSSSEREIEKKLISEMKRFSKIIHYN